MPRKPTATIYFIFPDFALALGAIQSYWNEQSQNKIRRSRFVIDSSGFFYLHPAWQSQLLDLQLFLELNFGGTFHISSTLPS